MNDQHKKLIEAIEDCGYTPDYSYSGRGMYGKKCFGFTGSESAARMLMKVLGELSTRGDTIKLLPEFISDLEDCKEDSMGYDRIVYFPSLEIEDPETETETEV